MFEQVGRLAEKAAMNVSRRAFLGRLSQGALGLAAAIGGVLAFPAQARAADQCCMVFSIFGGPCYYYTAFQGTCPCGGGLASCQTAKGGSCRKMHC